jgi:hypothetical protein
MGMLEDYVSDLNKVQQQYDEGDRNLLEYILGTGYYGVAKPIESITSAVIPDLGVGEAIGEALDKTGIPDYINENVPEDVRRALAEGAGLAGVIPVGRALGTIRSPENKGMFTSSGDVYKKGHYNPEEVEVSKAEKIVGDAIATDLGLAGKTLNNVANVYKKGRGTAEFIAKGLGRVGNLIFNPKSRALYTEYGISPVYKEAFDAYETALKSGNKADIDSAIQIAHAQMQQMAHIKRQSGQKPKKYDATEEFALASADPNVPQMYFKPGDYEGAWFHKTASKGAMTPDGKTDVGFRKQDSDFIQEHVQNAWKFNPDKTRIIVKAPRSDITGNHFNDVLARNTAVSDIAELFLDKGKFKAFDSVDDLADALDKLQTKSHRYKKDSNGKPVLDKDGNKVILHAKGDKKTNAKTGKNLSPSFGIKATDDTGVWITMGKAGTAKVEGGVNMLVKVDKNGNLIGVMSDVHDFYEKARIPKTNITIRNRPMEAALPTTVLAVTPPMQSNVVSISRGWKYNKDGSVKKTGKFSEADEAMRIDQGTSMPLNPMARKVAAEDRLRRTAALAPSKAEIARQAIPVAQNIAFTQGMLSGPRELEE